MRGACPRPERGDSEWFWLVDQVVSRPSPREASNHPGLIKHHLWGLKTEMKAHQGEGGDSRKPQFQLEAGILSHKELTLDSFPARVHIIV